MDQYHYTVLHFTILEKMAELTGKKVGEYYHKLTKNRKKTDHYLILTSGKGIPSNLPGSSYFINFSTLKYDINILSKVGLVQHLNAVRIHHKPHKS